MSTDIDVSAHRRAVEFADGVFWVGALDPSLRNFDIILTTANGTTYNAYLVKGSDGVAVIDTVKENFSDEFFARLESEVDYGEIKAIVLNHLEPDHSGALPELMRRAPQAQAGVAPAGGEIDRVVRIAFALEAAIAGPAVGGDGERRCRVGGEEAFEAGGRGVGHRRQPIPRRLAGGAVGVSACRGGTGPRRRGGRRR